MDTTAFYPWEGVIRLNWALTRWPMRIAADGVVQMLPRGCGYEGIYQTIHCSKRKVGQVVKAMRSEFPGRSIYSTESDPRFGAHPLSDHIVDLM
jgi:hypothetical protein